MNTIKIALFALAGTTLKSKLMSQEMTAFEIGVQLENGLKDLKKLISLYVFDKKADYRIEIGDKGLNFVGGKFAASFSQVLTMVAAKKMSDQGRGAELKHISLLADQIEESIIIEPELLGKLGLAEKILDGNMIAFEKLSENFQIDFQEPDSVIEDAEVSND